MVDAVNNPPKVEGPVLDTLSREVIERLTRLKRDRHVLAQDEDSLVKQREAIEERQAQVEALLAFMQAGMATEEFAAAKATIDDAVENFGRLRKKETVIGGPIAQNASVAPVTPEKK